MVSFATAATDVYARPQPPGQAFAGAAAAVYDYAAAAGIVLQVDSSLACIHSVEVTRTRRHCLMATGTWCLLV
jgi:hypothetical protein